MNYRILILSREEKIIKHCNIINDTKSFFWK